MKQPQDLDHMSYREIQHLRSLAVFLSKLDIDAYYLVEFLDDYLQEHFCSKCELEKEECACSYEPDDDPTAMDVLVFRRMSPTAYSVTDIIPVSELVPSSTKATSLELV